MEQKVGQKLKKKKLWQRVVSVKIGILQKNFNTLFLSLNTTSDGSITKIEPFLGELGPKTPAQNSPIHRCFITTKTFENL